LLCSFFVHYYSLSSVAKIACLNQAASSNIFDELSVFDCQFCGGAGTRVGWPTDDCAFWFCFLECCSVGFGNRFIADDQDAVHIVHEKYSEKLKGWHQQHGALVAEARTDLAKFLATQDKDVRERARDPERRRRVKAAVLLEKEIQLEYEFELIRAIPDEKFALWQQDKISRTVMGIMESLDLTKEQVERVHELSSLALQQTSSQKHWHSDAAAKLEQLVEQQILTPVQQEDFETVKDQNRLRYLSWNA